MEEFGYEVPQYQLHGLKFRFYSAKEIASLSVKEIRNPQTFDSLLHPTQGGLYDPALGPVDRDDLCSTCGQNYIFCPGHMGHIQLPLTVYNAVYFKTLYQILKFSCFECHRLRISASRANLFISQCRLLDKGHLVASELLHDYFCQLISEHGENTQLEQPIIEKTTEFTNKLLNEHQESDVSVKNIEAAHTKLIVEFIKELIQKPKCDHCKARRRLVRQEQYAKILLAAARNLKEADISKSRKSESVLNEDDEGIANDSENDLDPAELKISGSNTVSGMTFLTPIMVRDHLQEVWNNDSTCLKWLFRSLAYSPSDNPMDIFFLDIIPVPPSRFRPLSVMKDKKFENSQTSNLCQVIGHCHLIRQLLWEIEKINAQTDVKENDLKSSVLDQVPGKTLTEKMDNAWIRLQILTNCIVDGTLDKLATNKSTGIKQILEKKEGLMRKHMMGKRVNYAARSVISPDPCISTNEIGIPEVFAKRLTYPQPVTPWNVKELRQAVLNGPDVHPGACFVINEDGCKVLLTRDRTQREAIAKQLLTPSTSERSILGTKKVYRHLKNGDILLLNRQPTLHRPSIQAHKARVLPKEKTLRLHYSNCKAYNADFDGDEMNAHFPQNEIGRSEAYNIACTDHQYLVPKDGTPLAGLIQDHMVSGVSLTIRGRFFNRHDYCHLVYSALVDKGSPVTLLPPSIWKPFRLWSGKQVVSTVLLNLLPKGKEPLTLIGKSKIPEKSWQRHAKSDCKYIDRKVIDEMGESHVIIREGHLLCGVLDKAHYGPTLYGLVHSCHELYGGEMAGNLLTSLSRLFLKFLQIRGFSLGVKDVLVTKKADRVRQKIIKSSTKCGEEAYKQALDIKEEDGDTSILPLLRSAHYSSNEHSIREIDRSMRSKTDLIQNDIVSACMPQGLQQLFPDNNLQLMVQSGAKGSSVNCMQISCLLGQIELEGKRPPLMVSGKTLPSFKAYDVTPRAGGFVTDRFLTGVRPQEYFFHCMAGREGLVDTAVKTSKSGYLQRCLVKHLEGVIVNYDMTVRDSDGSIIQFYYGEDGLDVCKTGYLNPEQFPFLLQNRNILLRANKSQSQNHKEDCNVNKKIHKLQTQIDKWKRKCPASGQRGVRTSGFLHFCQTKEEDFLQLANKHEMGAGGRSKVTELMVQSWQELNEKKQKKLWKYHGPCPEPVLSRYKPFTANAVPEKLNSIIQEFAKKELPQTESAVSKEEFQNLIGMKVTRALAEPGEAVGLLCAQSVGEPSTQMTLNTFHFAGRGEMNVTLGIPRLREILMVASKNIKTPAMDVPVYNTLEAVEKANFLKRFFKRVRLHEVLNKVEVCEYLSVKCRIKHDRKRMFRIRFIFLPLECYKNMIFLTPPKILNFMENIYFKHLTRLIRKKIKSLNRVRILNHGRVQDVRSVRTSEAHQDADEMQDPEADEDEKSDKEDNNDGDASAMKAQQKRQEEQEYEPDEDEQQDNDKYVDEVDVHMDITEDIRPTTPEFNKILTEDMDEIPASSQNGDTSISKLARINRVCHSDPCIESYKYDEKKELWCEILLSFGIVDSKIDITSIIEADAQQVIVHEVPGITRCLLSEEKGPLGTELHLKTEGVNMHELYKYTEALDLSRLFCNDVHAVASTYGIEAANKVIIQEIKTVFAAYGIEVDYRHLSLLADYMTFEGTYKPFNRIALESSASPLQKMSFETTMHFLVNASIQGREDNLKSPSSQLVVGRVVSCGTGSFDLLQPLM
ncbi:hypothetical protein ACJMK2_041634 [Sinanodonta woodiana]|uniref:DNA-directed RNA polymerase subunit n=1 Tax=Sinanodonta woodiana TaxID=1069815 RepID=A0ABD3W6M6_SINWO